MDLRYKKIFIAYIVIVLGIHILCTLMEWPGRVSLLVILPIFFSLIVFFRSLYELVNKKYKASLQFLCLSLMAFCQGIKVTFFYYNIFAHALLLLLIGYFYYKNKNSTHLKFIARQKYLLLPFVYTNCIILLIPDIWVHNYINFNKKVWRSDETIEWSDFKATPDSSSKYAAYINSNLIYKINEVYNYPQVVVSAMMMPDESWTKTKLNASLLKHEQIHFSITEIYARKFENINSHWPLIPVIIEDSLTKISMEHYLLDSLYDSETNHSLNVAKQLEWDKKVEKLLNE
jgi:hypothetical protein